MKRGEKYRGLLLYAKNTAGEKVGSWELPPESKINFHTPPGECAEKAVMHSGADEKNYHHVFPFRAPDAGTGTITFESLLKVGPANTGYFVWPNAEKLTLKENKKTQNPQVWFKGAPGKSCTQVCQDMGGSCFAEALGSVKNPVSLQAAIGRHYACKPPMLKGECNKGMPAEATSDSF